MKKFLIKFFRLLPLVLLSFNGACSSGIKEDYGKHCGDQNCPRPVYGDCRCFKNCEYAENTNTKKSSARSQNSSSNVGLLFREEKKSERQQLVRYGEDRNDSFPSINFNFQPNQNYYPSVSVGSGLGSRDLSSNLEGIKQMGKDGVRLAKDFSDWVLEKKMSSEELEAYEDLQERLADTRDFGRKVKMELDLSNEREKNEIFDHEKNVQFSQYFRKTINDELNNPLGDDYRLMLDSKDTNKKLAEHWKEKEKYYSETQKNLIKIAEYHESLLKNLKVSSDIFVPSCSKNKTEEVRVILQDVKWSIEESKDRYKISEEDKSDFKSLFENIRKQEKEIYPLYVNLRDKINPKLYREQTRDADTVATRELLETLACYEYESIDLLKSCNQDPAKYGYRDEVKEGFWNGITYAAKDLYADYKKMPEKFLQSAKALPKDVWHALSNPRESVDKVASAIEAIPDLAERMIDLMVNKCEELKKLNNDEKSWVLGNVLIRGLDFYASNKIFKFAFTPSNIKALGFAGIKIGGETCKDFKILKDGYLKKLGIDPHTLKKDFLGKDAAISNYDIYRRTDTRELIILRKNGLGAPIHTGHILK